MSDSAQKQYFTEYFPKEKEEAERKEKKFAVNHVRINVIPLPEKNSQPSDPIRKNYDSVFQSAFNEEFERYFGLRAFSTINDQNISEMELIYANKPKQFKLLPGDKTVIKVISEVSKELVESMPPINMDHAVDQTERSIQTPKQAIKPQKAVDRLTKGNVDVHFKKSAYIMMIIYL
ncbi:Uncharacterized protein APZ42_017716 [Daphnia magna]|uniref:Uncharacterized protein n=1 Tax=Daphnia magna TaxID=35525 RepID=A0A164ZN03_9CRUS|nr:Uncharacterized protein APZ42_017716 [Daphnia magna]